MSAEASGIVGGEQHGAALVQRAAEIRTGRPSTAEPLRSGMPFKHNAARRHRVPMVRYRVRNWREYEAGLQRRGDLTLWLDQAAMAGWQAPRRTTPGGQAWHSDVAMILPANREHAKSWG
jgi:hypothetical protein